MHDLEARLRRTLEHELDPIVADPGRASRALRRARRERALRGIAAGLAAVLVAGAAAVALERTDEPRPRPAAEPEDVMTFALDFGTLTIDVPKAQACMLPAERVVDPWRLHYDDGNVDEVVEYLHPTRRPRCEALDPSEAARVIAQPGRHYVALGPGTTGGERSSLAPLTSTFEDVPYVAEIVCSLDGAVALTPRVQPRRDGVTFRVHNQDGAWEEFAMTTPGSSGTSGGRFGRKGLWDSTGNVAPGRHLVGCFRETRDVPYGDPDHPDFAEFSVVDPRGLWIDPALDCERPRQRREIPTDEPSIGYAAEADFEALIRGYVPGVLPDDVIVRATYPESAAKIEHRTLVRDGRKIATFYLTGARDPEKPANYLWAVDSTVCRGSGIAGG